MRVRLHSPFDWKVPGKRAVIAFAPGIHSMTHTAGAEAVAAGAGVEVAPEPQTPAAAATKRRRRGPAN